MSSLLDSTNPHGIRVVADRAPLREDVQSAFLKASRKATAGIAQITHPKRRSAATKTAAIADAAAPAERSASRERSA